MLLSRMLLALSENDRFMATLVDMPVAGGVGVSKALSQRPQPP